MKERGLRIDYTGLSGFPYGLAAIEKQKLIARGLAGAGARVTILCNRWGSFNSGSLQRKGEFMGVHYRYTSPALQRPSSFLARRLALLAGWWKEIFLLLARKQDVILVSSEDFFQVLAYVAVARIKRKKIFLTYVEDVNALFAGSATGKAKAFLFGRYVWRMLDGAFPISEYLMQSVKASNKDLPLMKLPTLVDFSLFPEAKEKTEKYFLFCGAAQYLEVIRFIVDAYGLAKDNGHWLYLVANGSELEIRAVKNVIERSPKKDAIRLFGFLSYEELIGKYVQASGLLIPLRDNLRDIARFPHKIGEYCASRAPILSTDIGEVHHYFANGENALLAGRFDAAEFALVMEYAASHPEEASKIGRGSRKTGEEQFDYRVMGRKMHAFMERIVNH